MPHRPDAMLLAVATAGMLLAACNGDEEAQPPPPTEAAEEPTAAATEEQQGGGKRDGGGRQEGERVRTYTVKRGDTLTSIAREMNSTVDAIVRANNLEDPDSIFPGDELKIPTAR